MNRMVKPSSASTATAFSGHSDGELFPPEQAADVSVSDGAVIESGAAVDSGGDAPDLHGENFATWWYANCRWDCATAARRTSSASPRT